MDDPNFKDLALKGLDDVADRLKSFDYAEAVRKIDVSKLTDFDGSIEEFLTSLNGKTIKIIEDLKNLIEEGKITEDQLVQIAKLPISSMTPGVSYGELVVNTTDFEATRLQDSEEILEFFSELTFKHFSQKNLNVIQKNNLEGIFKVLFSTDMINPKDDDLTPTATAVAEQINRMQDSDQIKSLVARLQSYYTNTIYLLASAVSQEVIVEVDEQGNKKVTVTELSADLYKNIAVKFSVAAMMVEMFFDIPEA